MAGDRQDQKVNIEVALLKQSMTVMEHTVISQNAAVRSELSSMNEVLREIHNKLDKTILDQSVQSNTHQHEIAAAHKEISRVNSRLSKAGGIITAIMMAVIGGVFSWFTPGKS